MATKTEPPRLTIRDPQVLRALAHPARLAIMEHLMSGATGTATECAEVCHLSPSATSYHLRALARVGLVEEAPSRGDGRERVWQSGVRGFDINADTAGDPLAQAAERDLIRMVFDRQERASREWLDRVSEEPADWQDAAALAEARLLMTAAELDQMSDSLMRLVEPYRLRNRQSDPPAGARPVTMIYRAYPTD